MTGTQPDEVTAYLAEVRDSQAEVVHECPPRGSGVMPCCGRTPVEVPLCHRLTLDPALVTCTGAGTPPAGEETQ